MSSWASRLRSAAKVAASWPVGLALAGFTWLDDQDAPPHFVSPKASAVFGAYSAGAIALRPGYLGLASHALNLAVQGFKITTSFQSDDAKLTLTAGVPRTRVVVLGSGWGSMSFIKNLGTSQVADSGWYDITLVSPRNYFLYTPLLPGAVTGTVESKSIVESVRSLIRGKGKYYEAQCFDIDPVKKVVRCRYDKPFKGVDAQAEFDIPYDVLVVGVGAINNTFNIPGVQEHCYFLKEMEDAQALRSRVHECLEYAALPSTSPELRQRLLTFVVVGGGPTGVETAAELHDMVQDDLRKLMPHTAAEVQIKLVETRDHILSMYDKQISAYTEKHFNREGIELLLNKMVQKVDSSGMHVKNVDGKSEFINAGTMVWCTGIKLNPLAVSLMNKLPKEEQQNARAIKTNGYLQVKGSKGSIFALGDTATIEQDRLLEQAEALFKQGDTNNNGLLSCSEIRELLKTGSRKYPHLASIENYFSCDNTTMKGFLSNIGKMMSTGAPEASVVDDAESREFTFEEFRKQLEAIDKTLRALPATAQVANQQGRFLAHLFTKYHITPGDMPADAPAFKYKHLGSFAYVGGDKAVMEVAVSGDKPGILTGWLMGWAWKGIESYMQISLKNKYLVSRDWVKAKVFGRDMSDV